MPEKQYRTLTKRTVDRLSVRERDMVFWDRDIPGFGVRVYPSGAKVYVVQTRASGKSRRVTIGRHGEVSPDQARRDAVEAISALKSGRPVSKEEGNEPTVADLAERYLREYVAVFTKKTTGDLYRHILGKNILPVLGSLKVSAVEKDDILSFQYGLRDTPTTANRALDVLKKMFGLAELWEMIPSGGSPCRSVRRYRRDAKPERFLTPEELASLGRTLEIAPEKGIATFHATAAIRLLVLTGCRRNEILELRWEDLDFDVGEFRLRDSKAGPRMVPMPQAVAEVFLELKRAVETEDGKTPIGKKTRTRFRNSPWVFPGVRTRSHMVNLNAGWQRIRAHADLKDVRLHDLRHTYASRALSLGEGLPMIGRLLGHRDIGSTARYAHLARESVRNSTAKVAESIATDTFMASAVGSEELSTSDAAAGRNGGNRKVVSAVTGKDRRNRKKAA
ncbi:MAG: tyrosine-type recombinase/integrase [Gammaproteobacteria bacterium]|nr:tyrosine-type recombinase/integrase [Gammaproteobacteria bacterium]